MSLPWLIQDPYPSIQILGIMYSITGSNPTIVADWAAGAATADSNEDEDALEEAVEAGDIYHLPAACSLGSMLASTFGSSPDNPIIALGSDPSIWDLIRPT